MPFARLVVSVTLLAWSAFSGARVDVSLELRTRGAPPDARPEAVLSAAPHSPQRGARIAPRPPIRVRTEAPGKARLDLYPEIDHLLAVKDGLWAPPVVLRSADPPEELTLTASGAGVLRMELESDPGRGPGRVTGQPIETWPEVVRARFQLVETPLEIGSDRSFETDCPVSIERRSTERGPEGETGEERRVLVCELPEGVLDVRLEAEGFIPHYLWELRMKPGGSVEPAPYELERGASLIGTAVRDDGSPAAGAEVILGPTVADSVARATLGGRVSSDAEGELFGILPREGAWDVEIRAEEPKVRVVERGLTVEIDPGLGAAELVIELSGTSIDGRVLDEEGEPVAGAQVVLQAMFREAGITQMEAGPDGGFAVAGQRPGTYHLQALGRGGTSSAVEVVEVIEDRSTPPVELVVRDPREVEGRVVSPSGRGVPGAVVWPIREVGSPPPLERLVRQVRSGPDGEFRLELGPGRSHSAVAILAPGFPLALKSVPSESENGSMEVVLEPPANGGRLILVDVRGSGPAPGGTVTIDDRWMLPLFLLTQGARHGGARASNEPLVIQDLPPGRYQVCVRSEAPQPTCTGGFVSAGASLELHSKEETR